MSDFFTNPVVQTFLGLGVCFVLASGLLKVSSKLKALYLPLAILAGTIGAVARYLDPTLMDVDVLKTIVYHGLAIVFITVGLQVPPPNVKTQESLTIGFAISSAGALQGLVGATLIMVLSMIQGSQLHPGLGLLLPLGFNQGPGQALSFGRAWEVSGLVDGSDIGIIIAALGFVWSIVVGIPLVLYGRKKGWLETDWAGESFGSEGDEDTTGQWLQNPETLTTTVSIVVATYFATFLLIDGLAGVLAAKEKLVNMLWGLHFVFALFVSMGVRGLFMRGVGEEEVRAHNERLQVLSNLAVDVTTASGLIAIQVAILASNLGLILLLTTLGGICSLAFALWVFRRAFVRLPFHHLVVWFGACTGTFPMGLSLLRMIDPNLSTPCATNFSKGAAFALVTSAPLLALLAYAIGQYPDAYPSAGWTTIALLLAYWLVLMAGWSRLWVKSSD